MDQPSPDTLAKLLTLTGDEHSPPHTIVIGDSHSLFFAGAEQLLDTHADIPRVHAGYRVYYVGPGLAASLVKPVSANRTREKALLVLDDARRTACRTVLLAFGEIDCRYHIRQRAIRHGADHPDHWLLSARVTALHYLSFAMELKLRGWRPLLWGPPPTTMDAGRWVTLGTMQERNWLTKAFTYMLREEGARLGIPVLSLIDQLVDAQLATRPDCMTDGVHLSQRCWPLWEAARRQASV